MTSFYDAAFGVNVLACVALRLGSNYLLADPKKDEEKPETPVSTIEQQRLFRSFQLQWLFVYMTFMGLPLLPSSPHVFAAPTTDSAPRPHASRGLAPGSVLLQPLRVVWLHGEPDRHLLPWWLHVGHDLWHLHRLPGRQIVRLPLSTRGLPSCTTDTTRPD